MQTILLVGSDPRYMLWSPLKKWITPSFKINITDAILNVWFYLRRRILSASGTYISRAYSPRHICLPRLFSILLYNWISVVKIGYQLVLMSGRGVWESAIIIHIIYTFAISLSSHDNPWFAWFHNSSSPQPWATPCVMWGRWMLY